jgi:hypothetical protein
VRGAQERGHHHRDAAFHVERAASPDPPVDELAAERLARPILSGRRHDVHVTLQQER